MWSGLQTSTWPDYIILVICNAYILHLPREVVIGAEIMNKKVKLSIQVKSSGIQQAVTQDDGNSPTQRIRSLKVIISSEKFYQSHAIALAEEFIQAVDANCLEEINILFDKVLDLNENWSLFQAKAYLSTATLQLTVDIFQINAMVS